MMRAGKLLCGAVFTLSLITAASSDDTPSGDAAPNVPVLQAEIKMLRETVERLSREVKALKDENTRLRKLLEDNGIDPTAHTERPQPEEPPAKARGVLNATELYELCKACVSPPDETDAQREAQEKERAEKKEELIGARVQLPEVRVGNVTKDLDRAGVYWADLDCFNLPTGFVASFSAELKGKTALTWKRGDRVTVLGRIVSVQGLSRMPHPRRGSVYHLHAKLSDVVLTPREEKP